jgi:hypothetical protein
MVKSRKNTLISNFSERAFWDVNVNMLDYKKNMRFIIERVFVHGNDEDEKLLNEIYSKRQIKRSVLESKELNESVINYLSVILDLKKELFNVVSKYRYI